MKSETTRLAEYSRHRIVEGILFTIVVVLTFLTVAGFLGKWNWLFNLVEQFRLQYAIAAIVMCVASLRKAQHFSALGAALVLSMNIYGMAPKLAMAGAEADETGKLVLMNLLYDNDRPQEVIEFLRREDSDVVVLLEAASQWEPYLQQLEDLYPYQTKCDGKAGIFVCLAILSKRRWIEASAGWRKPEGPAMAVARFGGEEPMTVIGIHMYRPTTPSDSLQQSRQFAILADDLKHLEGPLVVAGDFNSTPWTGKFSDFVRQSGLRRLTSGLSGTWPVPIARVGLAIDHVLVSNAFAASSVETGPSVGSDHLSLITTIRVSPAALTQR